MSVCVCVCVSVFSILPSRAFRRPTRGISSYSVENAVKLKKPCHKETDSVDLVVYQVNQLSLGLHTSNNIIQPQDEHCLFPCDNLPAKRSIYN